MKKTLLIAAAALAASVISSQAQVYSKNVVGYYNKPCPSGVFVLVANQLDNGTNKANDVLSALPNKSLLQIWNGTGFTPYTKTSSGFAGNPSLPVGTGFFVRSASNFTNTFSGNVALLSGEKSTNNLPAGVFVLTGSTIPVGGNLNDTGTNTLNLIATLPNKSLIQTWNGSGFTPYTKTSSGFAGNPAFLVGQGLFIRSASASSWVQTFTNQ